LTLPTHHPSEETLLDFARGALTLGRSLVLRAHLGACPTCRASVRVAEAVGGALLAELAPTEMASDALPQALARIERPPEPVVATAIRTPDNWIRVPTEVLVAAAQRRRWAAPGVWVAPVTRDRKTGERSYLLGIGRGIAVPKHTHKGVETVCVVAGAYEDRGAAHLAGDFAENDEAVEHKPRVTMDGDCVCLIAADNALVARDLLGWIMQPLVRI